MTWPAPPEAPWLDGTVVVGDSPIAGRGLFASASIEPGTVVTRLGGRLVTTAELLVLLRDADEYVDTLAVFDDAHLVLPAGSMVHFGNHSCDPNLWHVGPYELAARRSIAAGEELTVDYGTQSDGPGFSMPCSCGSPWCRGVVTSADWRLPALQSRYAGHWTPVLAERIARPGSFGPSGAQPRIRTTTPMRPAPAPPPAGN